MAFAMPIHISRSGSMANAWAFIFNFSSLFFSGRFRVGVVGAFRCVQPLGTWDSRVGMSLPSIPAGICSYRESCAFNPMADWRCHPYRNTIAAGEGQMRTYAAGWDNHGGRKRYPDCTSMLSCRVPHWVDPRPLWYPIVVEERSGGGRPWCRVCTWLRHCHGRHIARWPQMRQRAWCTVVHVKSVVWADLYSWGRVDDEVVKTSPDHGSTLGGVRCYSVANSDRE